MICPCSPFHHKCSFLREAHHGLHVVFAQLKVKQLEEKNKIQYVLMHYTSLDSVLKLLRLGTCRFSLIRWGVADLAMTITFLWMWNLRRTWGGGRYYYFGIVLKVFQVKRGTLGRHLKLSPLACAGVLLCLSAIALIFGSSSREGSSEETLK